MVDTAGGEPVRLTENTSKTSTRSSAPTAQHCLRPGQRPQAQRDHRRHPQQRDRAPHRGSTGGTYPDPDTRPAAAASPSSARFPTTARTTSPSTPCAPRAPAGRWSRSSRSSPRACRSGPCAEPGVADVGAARAPCPHSIAAAMSSSPIDAYLERLHERWQGDGSGAVADYIPPLALADPDWFGIAVATTDGHCYEVGDSRREFTIQSISKPFTYGLALADRGFEAVDAKVGVEPSGDAFNSISLAPGHGPAAEPDDQRRRDHLDLAGRRGRRRPSASARMLAAYGASPGGRSRSTTTVYESERDDRPPQPRDRPHAAQLRHPRGRTPRLALDLYFRQCSVAVDCRDLSLMAATLANGGVNPAERRAGARARVRRPGAERDDDLRHVRLGGGVGGRRRDAGQERRRRRRPRGAAGAARDRRLLAAAGPARQQRPRDRGLPPDLRRPQPQPAPRRPFLALGRAPHLHRRRGALAAPALGGAGGAAGRGRRRAASSTSSTATSSSPRWRASSAASSSERGEIDLAILDLAEVTEIDVGGGAAAGGAREPGWRRAAGRWSLVAPPHGDLLGGLPDRAARGPSPTSTRDRVVRGAAAGRHGRATAAGGAVAAGRARLTRGLDAGDAGAARGGAARRAPFARRRDALRRRRGGRRDLPPARRRGDDRDRDRRPAGGGWRR